MRRKQTILAILLAAPLAGCMMRAKTAKTPPPAAKPVTTAAAAPAPPPPLSIPQTRAELPPPQPVPVDAMATVRAPEEEPVPAPAPPAKPAISRGPRPQQPAAPKPEAPAPAIEPGREPVQEALHPEEKNRLREEAAGARREVTQLLDRLPQRVRTAQRDRMERIRTFVQQSEDFERRGDMRQAAELAQRALVLAREIR